jgi:hypothetical protein
MRVTNLKPLHQTKKPKEGQKKGKNYKIKVSTSN